MDWIHARASRAPRLPRLRRQQRVLPNGQTETLMAKVLRDARRSPSLMLPKIPPTAPDWQGPSQGGRRRCRRSPCAPLSARPRRPLDRPRSAIRGYFQQCGVHGRRCHDARTGRPSRGRHSPNAMPVVTRPSRHEPARYRLDLATTRCMSAAEQDQFIPATSQPPFCAGQSAASSTGRAPCCGSAVGHPHCSHAEAQGRFITLPSAMTKATRCSTRMSSRGSPGTAITSAA